MKNQIGKTEKSNYFIGLDIGTNSTGYVATSEDYTILKYRQQPVWGVHLFDSANDSSKRRTYRTARRRLDRRLQRIQLLRELFAQEIAKIDPLFFRRIDESSLKSDAKTVPYAIFAEKNFTDRHYYKKYPTIHHLIVDLMESNNTFDVRLVYVACAWILAHRGHFFSSVDKEKIHDIFSFSNVYGEMQAVLEERDIYFPWNEYSDPAKIKEHLTRPVSRTERHDQLVKYLKIEKKKDKNWNEFLKMLCGCEGNLSLLFGKEYESKLSLDSDDEKIAEILAETDDEDAAVIHSMKKVYDWSVLADIIGGHQNLSRAKVAAYEKHQKDLKELKSLIRKYLPVAEYNMIFRPMNKDGKKNEKTICNYAAYRSYCDRDGFYKFLKGKLDAVEKCDCTDEDRKLVSRIREDIELKKFLPKQVNTDNRIIPYQLYWNELKILLEKASRYLPFLSVPDEQGLSTMDKILSIMEFRIPYFVGPLNTHSQFSWFKRKAEGRILPWNIEEKVDFDASEEKFIGKMLNRCTYLPDQTVLPKKSLLYQKFEVLNLINNITIEGQPISVPYKQKIYDLFLKYSKVTKKGISKFLKSENCIENPEHLAGIDETVTASLDSWRFFEPFMESGKLTADEVEDIIYKGTVTEDKRRFAAYLLKNFSKLSEEEQKKIAGRKFSGFGRLSKKFLTMIPDHGEKSIINMMWEQNLNLQKLLGMEYPFCRIAEKARREYYSVNPMTLEERLDSMYVPSAVRRPVIRTMKVLKDVVKTIGYAPSRIFVEMARDVTDAKSKGKRTVSRYDQLHTFYRQISNEDSREMTEELRKYENNTGALQRDVLYLYFMQLGRDMYTGDKIRLEDLLCNEKLYNKEHIYPQSKVKDDSIINNIVLVNSKINGDKSDAYPVSREIQSKMSSFWEHLHKNGLISEEKYKRLTRSTPFSDDEKWGFINRQLVETRQSAKAVTELIRECYPESEIVYVKAGLVSEFRHGFNLLKSRTVNDLHHGKDAFLSVVVGNVYHGCFTGNWFANRDSDDYSIKTEKLFSKLRYDFAGRQVWSGKEGLSKVHAVMKRNFLHLTSYTYCQHGGLFDQNPVKANEGLIPLKKGKKTEKYGGYNKPAASFFVLALSENKGKKVKKALTFVPVNLMDAPQFMADKDFAAEYVQKFIDPKSRENLTVDFPLGLKPIRIKSVIEVDGGLRFCLNGKSSGGTQLLISIFTPLLLDEDLEQRVKKLESFCGKWKKNPKLEYSERYDGFSPADMIRLYDILAEKLESGIYAKRPANPVETLRNGREKFVQLSIPEQVEILLNLIKLFGRGSAGGVDLIKLGGSKKGAATTLSSNLANWKTYFKSACIVYSNAGGLYEEKSINLLELI